MLQAQAPRQNVIGEVTAIDAASHKITLKQDKTGTVFQVNPDEKATYIRIPPGETDLKKGTKLAAADVVKGDRLMARGVVSEELKTIAATTIVVISKTDLSQKQEKDREEWTKRGVSGAVTAVDAAKKEFTVTVRALGTAKPVQVAVLDATSFRRYAPDSVRFADAKPSKFDAIKVGDQARVLADKPVENGIAVAVEVVSGEFHNLAVMVDSVDAAGKQIKVTNIETKKPVIVKINSDSQLRKLPEQMAAMLVRILEFNKSGGAGGGAGGGRPGGPGAGSGAGAAGGGRPGGMAGGGGTPGGPGASSGRRPDFQQMLERSPAFELKDLKKGDVLIIATTVGLDSGVVTAITVVAGVDPLLRAAPARQVIGGWNMEMGVPMQ